MPSHQEEARAVSRKRGACRQIVTDLFQDGDKCLFWRGVGCNDQTVIFRPCHNWMVAFAMLADITKDVVKSVVFPDRLG